MFSKNIILWYNLYKPRIFPLLGLPDSIGLKANESITKGGVAMMHKFVNLIQHFIIRITGHKYSGITLKTPFINLSFAPVYVIAPFWGFSFK